MGNHGQSRVRKRDSAKHTNSKSSAQQEIEQRPLGLAGGTIRSLFGAAPTSHDLLNLNRLVGNRAVGRILQRQFDQETVATQGVLTETNERKTTKSKPLEPSTSSTHTPAGIQRQTPKADDRTKLIMRFNFAVRNGKWGDAALLLNGFSDGDIKEQVVKLSRKRLIRLTWGALRKMPGWSDRVTDAINAHDSEAGRIGRLYFEYTRAYEQHDWERMAVLLNGFSEGDIKARLKKLNNAELETLKGAAKKAMPGHYQRVVGLIEQVAGATEKLVGPGTGPIAVGSGKVAVRALKMLESAKPIEVSGGVAGTVKLVPGAHVGDKLLLSAAPLVVYYIDGVTLYKAYTPDFVRDIWLTALGEGASRAAWLIPIMKAEMAFIQAFIAPWYMMLGIGILKGIVFYANNKDAIHLVAGHLDKINNLRTKIKQKYPTLYSAVLRGALKQVLVNMPEGITLEDIAYLLGRILGFQGILGKVEAGIEITLKVVLKIVAEYVVLVGILHAPQIAAHGLEHALKEEARNLQQRLEEAGVTITEDQSRKIIKEISKDPDVKAVMEELKVSAESASKELAKLQKIAEEKY